MKASDASTLLAGKKLRLVPIANSRAFVGTFDRISNEGGGQYALALVGVYDGDRNAYREYFPLTTNKAAGSRKRKGVAPGLELIDLRRRKGVAPDMFDEELRLVASYHTAVTDAETGEVLIRGL